MKNEIHSKKKYDKCLKSKLFQQRTAKKNDKEKIRIFSNMKFCVQYSKIQTFFFSPF